MNLLHYAHEAATLGNLRPNACPVDVMDYIFNEMYDAVIHKKVPPYAPYVMMLIKAKYPFDGVVEDIDVELNCETHGRVKMNRKSAHLTTTTSGRRAPGASSSGRHAPHVSCPSASAPESSSAAADAPKKRPWIKRVLRSCFV